MVKFTLRQANEKDQPFLFKVTNEAMKPVREALDRPKTTDVDDEFAKYKDKYKPEEVEVIQVDKKPVGRLRVVRTKESIYIGGMQLLPEFQGKGIGTSILENLILESEESKIPIILEVHDVNTDAKSLYQRLGFKAVEKTKEQSIMKYSPSAQKASN